MSKAALWMTSRESPRKAAKSAATVAKTGLSARKAVVSPWTLTASSGTSRRGLT